MNRIGTVFVAINLIAGSLSVPAFAADPQQPPPLVQADQPAQPAPSSPADQPVQAQPVPSQAPSSPPSQAPSPPPVRAGGADRANLLTIITSYDPETQMMALTMTLQALQQGAAARVLLCGPGGDLALKSPPASAIAPQKPGGMSSRDVMLKIMQAGAPVEVCANYLPNRRLSSGGLVAGVGQASPDAVTTGMIAPNVRILSF